MYENDVIGKAIGYNDYLGCLRSGTIGFIEEYKAPQDIDSDGKRVVWIYVVDDDPEYNVHTMIIPDANGRPATLYYAEMRLSTEVFLDD